MVGIFTGAGLYQAFDQRRDYLRQRDIADAERLRDHAIQNAQLSMQRTQFNTGQQEAQQAMQERAQNMRLQAESGAREQKLFPGQLAAQRTQTAVGTAQLNSIRDQSNREGMGDMVWRLSSALNSHYAGKSAQDIANMSPAERAKLDTLTPAEIKSAVDAYNGQGNMAIDAKTFRFDPATHQFSFVFGPKGDPSSRQFIQNTLEGAQFGMYAMHHMDDKPTEVAPGAKLYTPMGGIVADNSRSGFDGSGLGSVMGNPTRYNGMEWSNSASGVVADGLGGKFANGTWNIDPANQEKWKVANNMIGQLEQKYGPNLDPHAAGAMVLDALGKGYKSDTDIDQQVKSESALLYHPSFLSSVGDWLSGNGGQHPIVHGIDTSKTSADDYMKQRTEDINSASQQNINDVLNNNLMTYFKSQNGVPPAEAAKSPGGAPAVFGTPSAAQPANGGAYPMSVQIQPGQESPGLQDASGTQ